MSKSSTPLTGVRGALELSAADEMTLTEGRRFLRNAAADTDRLARLVRLRVRQDQRAGYGLVEKTCRRTIETLAA